MKHFTGLTILFLIIGNIYAIDTESSQFMDHLLSIRKPGAPEVFEDTVIFTAPSSFRKVGIAFAHERYAEIHWFRKLMVSGEVDIPARNSKSQPTHQVIPVDSGILFHVYQGKEKLKELEYRLIVNGLWIADPANADSRIDPSTGLVNSLVSLPELPEKPSVTDAPPGSVLFSYTAAPGERITLAGSFNNWDPFMYTLKETSPGRYSLTLPLPPGVYHYFFIHKGARFLDPYNPKTAYTREGQAASEVVVK
jgi:hypothetical protein